MKLTWFGGETFRFHSGGAIVVVEPEGVATGIDPNELVSGADQVVAFADFEPVDSRGWKPRASLRPLDADELHRLPEITAFSADTLVIDADGEAPLVLTRGSLPVMGKWVEQGVVVVAGANLASRVLGLVENRSPRLIALAGSDAAVDAAFAALRDKLDGTGLVALERGLAVEV